MPSESKAQRKFMGMVHATQAGEIKAPSKEVAETAKEIKPEAAKHFAETKEKGLPEHVKKHEHEKKSFVNGFKKRAQEAGLTEGQAIDLVKEAAKDGSSWLGRYMAEKLPLSQYGLENPWRMGGMQQVGGGALAFLPTPFNLASSAASVAGTPEMLAARLIGGKTPEEKEKAYTDLVKGLDESSYGQQAGKGFKNYGLGMGLPLGALLGGVLGGARSSGDSMDMLKDILKGTGIGAGAGTVGMGAAGALGGLLNKAISSNISNESKERAIKMKANNPNATAPIFGDVIGAMNA